MLSLMLCLVIQLSWTYSIDALRLQIKNGEVKFLEFMSSGQCWSQVLTEMLESCSSLTDHMQHTYASKLTQCHLLRLKIPPESCFATENCEHIDLRSYTAYTAFFTHVFDICTYLNFAKWQIETSELVTALEENSQQVVKSLDLTQKSLGHIQQAQQVLHSSISKSIENQEDMNNYIKANKEEISSFMNQFLQNAKAMHLEIKEQQMWISEWMGKIYKTIKDLEYLNEFIIGEVFDIKSFVFYFGYFVATIILTSCSETQNARYKLLWGLLIQIALEKAMISHFSGYRLYSNYEKLLFIVLSGMVLLQQIKSYRNYEQLSYNLLKNLVYKLKRRPCRDSDTGILTPSSYHPSPLRYEIQRKLSRIPEVHSSLERDLELYRPLYNNKSRSVNFKRYPSK